MACSLAFSALVIDFFQGLGGMLRIVPSESTNNGTQAKLLKVFRVICDSRDRLKSLSSQGIVGSVEDSPPIICALFDLLQLDPTVSVIPG